jgi:hypothetical protein
MQIVENWTDIDGRVVGIASAAAPDEHTAVDVSVSSVRDVEGFANLLADAAGSTLRVLVRNDVAQRIGIRPGDGVRARVRKHGVDRVFAHPTQIGITSG